MGISEINMLRLKFNLLLFSLCYSYMYCHVIISWDSVIKKIQHATNLNVGTVIMTYFVEQSKHYNILAIVHADIPQTFLLPYRYTARCG